MSSFGFALFETMIGSCAIVWGARGIVAVQLPEANEAGTRRRVLARFPKACEAEPPIDVALARSGIIALLRGAPADFSGISLDTDGVPSFHRRVHEAARRIEPGHILTYGALARIIGSDGAARAVGQALARNPYPILVPCHRVLAANGGLGGFSAHGGIRTKRRLLEIEGIRFSAPLPIDGPRQEAPPPSSEPDGRRAPIL
jgi:methylated-DNA-[protein]-cysteine S-methyltransferase